MKYLKLIMVIFIITFYFSCSDKNEETELSSEPQLFEVILDITTTQDGFTFYVNFLNGGGDRQIFDGNNEKNLKTSKIYESIKPGVRIESFSTIPTESIFITIKNLTNNTTPVFETITKPISSRSENPLILTYDAKTGKVEITQ